MGDAMSDYLDPNNEELLKDFFVEAQLQVESLESNILVLENEPTNHDAIDEIFRAAHTLKGASATVQMLELSEFTHLVEDVLDRVRSDALHVTEDIIDLFLTSIDIVKEMLAARQNAGVFDRTSRRRKGGYAACYRRRRHRRPGPSRRPAPSKRPALPPRQLRRVPPVLLGPLRQSSASTMPWSYEKPQRGTLYTG